jgi:hypothetical protein
VTLLLGGIRQGNIIFDIECRATSEITPADIREIHGFADGPRDEAYAQKAMAKVADQNLSNAGDEFLHTEETASYWRSRSCFNRRVIGSGS